jgi:hypothetical protein
MNKGASAAGYIQLRSESKQYKAGALQGSATMDTWCDANGFVSNITQKANDVVLSACPPAQD